MKSHPQCCVIMAVLFFIVANPRVYSFSSRLRWRCSCCRYLDAQLKKVSLSTLLSSDLYATVSVHAA